MHPNPHSNLNTRQENGVEQSNDDLDKWSDDELRDFIHEHSPTVFYITLSHEELIEIVRSIPDPV